VNGICPGLADRPGPTRARTSARICWWEISSDSNVWHAIAGSWRINPSKRCSVPM